MCLAQSQALDNLNASHSNRLSRLPRTPRASSVSLSVCNWRWFAQLQLCVSLLDCMLQPATARCLDATYTVGTG